MKTVINHLFFPFSTVKKAYKILMAFLGLVPVLYIVYFSLTMAREGLALSEFLYLSPWNSILFLIVLLNVAWTYILIKIHPDLGTEEGNEYVGFILWLLFVSQIMITNIIFACICAIVLYKLKIGLKDVVKLDIVLRYKTLTAIAASLSALSCLVGFSLIQIIF